MMFGVTFLEAEPGKRLAKLYRDPNEKPEDYDGGALFRPYEASYETFAEFVDALTGLDPDVCVVRGELCDDARNDPDIRAGARVRRLAINRPEECDAAFRTTSRPWIVLDFDETVTPFDLNDP